MKHLLTIIIILLLLALGYLSWTTRHCLMGDGPQVITKTDTIVQTRTVHIPAAAPSPPSKQVVQRYLPGDTILQADTVLIYRDTMIVDIPDRQFFPRILQGLAPFQKQDSSAKSLSQLKIEVEHHSLAAILSSEYRITFPEKLIQNNRNIYLTEPRHQFFFTTDFGLIPTQSFDPGSAPLDVMFGLSYIRSDLMLRYNYSLTSQQHQFGAGFRILKLY